MFELDPGPRGRCRLTVEVNGGSSPSTAGVIVDVEEGRIVSCTSRLDGITHASASGPVFAWLRQMNGGPAGQLEMTGDLSLSMCVVEALRALAGSFATLPK